MLSRQSSSSFINQCSPHSFGLLIYHTQICTGRSFRNAAALFPIPKCPNFKTEMRRKFFLAHFQLFTDALDINLSRNMNNSINLLTFCKGKSFLNPLIMLCPTSVMFLTPINIDKRFGQHFENILLRSGNVIFLIFSIYRSVIGVFLRAITHCI